MQKQNKRLTVPTVKSQFDALIVKVTQEEEELQKALDDKRNQKKLLIAARDSFMKEE